MNIGKTHRGFAHGKFKDRTGLQCSIQKSSVATQDCIWLGLDDADPRIMASRAKANGVTTTETTGWVPYPIPKDVLLSTRMHLTRKDVFSLLPKLIKFVLTGNL